MLRVVNQMAAPNGSTVPQPQNQPHLVRPSGIGKARANLHATTVQQQHLAELKTQLVELQEASRVRGAMEVLPA